MFFISFKTLKFSICFILLMQMLVFTNTIYCKQNDGFHTSNKTIERINTINPKTIQFELFLAGSVFGLLGLASLIVGNKKIQDIPITPSDRIIHALRGIMREEDIEKAKKIDESEGWNCIYVSIASFIISYCCFSSIPN